MGQDLGIRLMLDMGTEDGTLHRTGHCAGHGLDLEPDIGLEMGHLLKLY